ncbi:MAG: ABC transporter ATP-binding protein [Bacteroidota bacterium]
MKNQLARSFSQLLLYMRPFRGEYLAAMFYSFLNKLFDLIPEILLGIAVNTVIEQERSWLSYWGVQDLRWQLLLLGFLTLAIYGLESIFEYLASTKWWRLAQLVQHSFRMEAFSHVQQSTMTAFSKQKVGNLLSILNEDINQLERFLEEGVDEIIEVLATSLLVGGIFFFLAPAVASLAALPIPLIVYATFLLQNRLSPLYFTIRQKAGLLSTQLANSLLGMVTVKSLVAERLEEAKVAEASCAYKEANFKAIRLGALAVPLVRLSIVFSYLVTLVYGGVLAIERRLDVGAYSTLISLCSRMLWPFADLAEISTNFQRVMASTGRLLDLFRLPVEVSPAASVALRGEITFSAVGFAYDKQAPTLRGLSFTISPGQTVAFVGATGAGKTTLLQLLLGFYFPTQGEVFFDGQEVRAASLAALRRQLGFVSQEPFLFEGTIAANISYACATATRDQVIQAAKHASAHEFIVQLPQGYDTWIGERGQALSGGQKQRLAIARAIVRNPAILILDEATSAVDNETELAIQKSLASISQGRTMILIAHRLSTVKQADQIFVLKRGTVVEQGTHAELLEQDRLYANLWKLQTGERLTNAELIAD